MSGADLKPSPKQLSFNDGEPPNKRARLEDSPVVSGSQHSHARPGSTLDGNTLPAPGSDVEDDPYSLDDTAPAHEHKASDLYLDTVCKHAFSAPETHSFPVD